MQNLISKYFFKIFLKIKKNHYLRTLERWSSSNLKSSLFFLSFDFETQRDVDVIERLTDKLKLINIKPFYAVPAELIEKNFKLFKNISNECTIINHGYKIHTKYNEKIKKNFSTFSYSNLSNSEIKNDIIRANNVLNELPNQKKEFFRTPHFGEFCESNSMFLIYEIISELNYKVSSSTTPIFSILNSPVYKSKNITEIPSSAYLDKPLQIIDSWGIHSDENLTYEKLFNEIDIYRSIMERKNFFLNLYFDPTDIINNDIFFKKIENLSVFQIMKADDIYEKKT